MAALTLPITWTVGASEAEWNGSEHIIIPTVDITLGYTQSGYAHYLFGSFVMEFIINGNTVATKYYYCNGTPLSTGEEVCILISDYSQSFKLPCTGTFEGHLQDITCKLQYIPDSNNPDYDGMIDQTIAINIKNPTQTLSCDLSYCRSNSDQSPTENPVECTDVRIDPETNDVLLDFNHIDSGYGIKEITVNVYLMGTCGLHKTAETYVYNNTFSISSWPEGSGSLTYRIPFSELTDPKCWTEGEVNVITTNTHNETLTSYRLINMGELCFNGIVDNNDYGETSLIQIEDIQVDKDTDTITVSLSHADNGNGLYVCDIEIRISDVDGYKPYYLHSSDFSSGNAIITDNTFDITDETQITVTAHTYTSMCSPAGDTKLIGTVEKIYPFVQPVLIDSISGGDMQNWVNVKLTHADNGKNIDRCELSIKYIDINTDPETEFGSETFILDASEFSSGEYEGAIAKIPDYFVTEETIRADVVLTTYYTTGDPVSISESFELGYSASVWPVELQIVGFERAPDSNNINIKILDMYNGFFGGVIKKGRLVFSATKVSSSLPGDVNSDGVIDQNDADLIYEIENGYDGIYYDADAADVNADGKINNKDAALIEQYLDGQNVTLLPAAGDPIMITKAMMDISAEQYSYNYNSPDEQDTVGGSIFTFTGIPDLDVDEYYLTATLYTYYNTSHKDNSRSTSFRKLFTFYRKNGIIVKVKTVDENGNIVYKDGILYANNGSEYVQPSMVHAKNNNVYN